MLLNQDIVKYDGEVSVATSIITWIIALTMSDTIVMHNFIHVQKRSKRTYRCRRFPCCVDGLLRW